MRIGLVTKWDTGALERLVRLELRSVQIVVWPGDVLDPAVTTARQLAELRAQLSAHDIQVSALAHYGNHLDPAEQPKLREHFVGLMGMARQLGADTVATFTGRDPEKSIEENIPAFVEYWKPLAKQAEGDGIRIAFENCPKFGGHPFRGSNIAFTPHAWDLMFAALPSPAIGLEWDAAHLICLGIEPLPTIRHYGARIFHVHAKDAEIRWDQAQKYGLLDERATRHRMVGLGHLNWGDAVSALLEIGYRGNLDIEGRHDPIYREKREEDGLRIARDTLRRFVPKANGEG